MTRAHTIGSLGRLAAALWIGAALACSSASAAFAEEDPRDREYPHGDWQEECGFCHDDSKFLPVKPTKDFKHPASLPMRGAHATAACSACHRTLDFGKPPRPDCVACHQDVHRGEFGMDCSRCHTTRTFLDRAEMARLHRMTRFPLSGAHAAADCEACHRPKAQGQLVYVGLATECAACHDSTGFPSAPQRPPSHADGDYPEDCSLCHSTVSFLGGRINHDATGFPLTGAHAALECARCHGEPFNPDLTPECVSCHLSDYQAVTDPSHTEGSFPLDCTRCHNTTSFDGARFLEHDTLYFPIYSGTHNGAWDRCSDCHTLSTNYSVFSCLGCHSQPETSPLHSGVSGYQYNSDACYACHPRGVAED